MGFCRDKQQDSLFLSQQLVSLIQVSVLIQVSILIQVSVLIQGSVLVQVSILVFLVLDDLNYVYCVVIFQVVSCQGEQSSLCSLFQLAGVKSNLRGCGWLQ